MSYKFDNNTSFEEYEEFVFDWARDDEQNGPPVRVQASAELVRNKWRLSWANKQGVKARFDEEKCTQMLSIEQAASGLSESSGVYLLG